MHNLNFSFSLSYSKRITNEQSKPDKTLDFDLHKSFVSLRGLGDLPESSVKKKGGGGGGCFCKTRRGQVLLFRDLLLDLNRPVGWLLGGHSKVDLSNLGQN
jgi:hypothetical protein